MDRTAQPHPRPLRRVAAATALLACLSGIPALQAHLATPVIARTATTSGGSCHLNAPSGTVQRAIYIEFDNLHFMRDPARDGSTNVPSDLEQMPHLLNFIKNNGALLTSHHTPLISHTSDDILTSITGVYPSRHGVSVAANSYEYYTPSGSTQFQSAFTYWTDQIGDGTYNLLSAPGVNAPAPWVPFTRAGCSVGAAGIADMELENTGNDINTVFGPGSPEAQEASSNPNQAFSDFVGIAVHCGQGDSACATTTGAVTDTLPSEPGGYTGYKALFGHKYTANLISPSAPITDVFGNPITNTKSMTNGFPGFNVSAAQSLGYIADMQEHGVPVTYGYIITAHNPIFPNTGNAYGPGQAQYVAQLKSYDNAFNAFFTRLANDGITPANTLFVITTDEGDHFVGGQPSPSGCDGVTVPCNYSAVGELNVNLRGLLQAEQGVTTQASVTNDDAPDVYLTNQASPPGPSDPTVRTFERATSALTVTNPFSPTGSNTDTLIQYFANPAEFSILHMLTADPLRTPTFTGFAQPDYYVTSSTSCGTDPTPWTSCVSENPAFAWNHGDVQPQITTGWLGLVGPGVATVGQDNTTWSDHTDIRPTMLSLLGLHDDYTSDGRLLIEDLTNAALPPAVQADRATFLTLAQLYKRLTAPVGQLGLASLNTSTDAIKSGSSADDSAFTQLESQLTTLGSTRDTLAGQIQAVLNGATFNNQAIDDAQARTLIGEANALLVSSTPSNSPKVGLVPSNGAAGPHITVTGSGFGADESATVSIFCMASGCGAGTQLLGTALTDSHGTFTLDVQVPSWIPTGPHSIGVQGLSSGRYGFNTYTVTSRPTLTVTPSSGPGNTPVTVSGTGFGAGESVSLGWYCTLPAGCGVGTRTLGTAMADSSGAFTATVTIPGYSPVGPHLLGATGQSSGLFAASVYQVTEGPTLMLRPSSGAAGSELTIKGQGYAKKELVTLSLYCTSDGCPPGSLLLDTVTTNGSGRFSLHTSIPASSPSGMHLVGAQGLTSGLYTDSAFSVTP